MKKAEYFSKDFEWDELRVEVENDPSLSYHLVPFEPSLSVAEEEEAESQPWNDFHHRHASGKFFKERRYLLQEFPELVGCEENSKVLEVGCGNGSTVLPILRGNEKVTVYACDCSTEALERVKETIYASNIVSIEHRFHTFCCDFSTSGFPSWLACNPCQANFEQTSDGRGKNESYLTDSSSLKESRCCIGGVDFVTLIFTLSALSLQRMPKSINECFSVMKPGGLLLFRDYGLYDMSMLRFEMDKKVGFREYMRSDGTRSYFFSLGTVKDLFLGAGFIELELEYCCVKSVNRRNGKSMRRVWVHGKFQKPI
ncbi:PREDICTED: methyltransferase-like protein 6 [Fragaria vesca subsp. vesca]|uniref:methyltransferase-like protein 6 n=1 Tax=Fragaria vesca subsp. vesca TaxID=101020 RepID=UPI0002C3316A|nr:PREDICTED: methyltransferase-like protein 6 [Fragaria vesca subsp. vesca]